MKIIPFGHLSIFINPFGLDITQVTRRIDCIYCVYALLPQQGVVIKCPNARKIYFQHTIAHVAHELDFYSVRY